MQYPRSLEATVERIDKPTDKDKGVRIRVLWRNTGSSETSLPAPFPGKPPQELNWPYTDESYRTALLFSYNMLSMSVVGPDGTELAFGSIAPWTTVARPADCRLSPGESLELRFHLSDFYTLTKVGEHDLHIEYGEAGDRVTARRYFQVGLDDLNICKKADSEK
ncbi:MAG: hypothetical protein P8X90_21830 [Desulfobacterales bacterium]